ncbi:MAG: [protein-PII] uridylyltransferase [Pseudomonadota bacterium]
MLEQITRNRAELAELHDGLASRYWRNDEIDDLIRDLSAGMDTLIRGIYARHLEATEGVALFAVGGYGRAQLHPHSDIDLLIVAQKPERHARAIELFWQEVFDLNIEVGHSVRSIRACRSEAKGDITIATAMFERRLLCGDDDIQQRLDKTMASRNLWPAPAFFAAKIYEQEQRHKAHDHIEYNLEPNLKSSPGGLRDIQTAEWICLRKFETSDPAELEALGVLTPIERRWLEDGKRFLWWVRFGLHLVAERKEDRLHFAHQRELAQRLGFVDTNAQKSVERFMYHYYRHVLELREVNDIIVQYFNEHLVPRRRRSKIQPVNERFHLVNNYIDAIDDDVFQKHPSSLLELFVVMANRNDIAGVRSRTIRLVRDNLHLIDDAFRADPANTRLFMELLKAPYTLVSQLTRMRRYGVLGRYIPEFGQVVGQMQHDLFHIYTVDAHTMAVIRNMRRFRYRASQEAFPVAYHCVHKIPKLELLYIAGLYHDIGKGRGGDHSQLGASDAATFCERHGLSDADRDLVCWLVESHLLMSSVAQREDIYDPEVVHAFATQVKSEMRLDYLYALTVADVNATNPTLWNSWRATLLRHLYTETRRVLRRGLESAADRATTIAVVRERALERMNLVADAQAAAAAFLERLGDDFFLRHTPPTIAEICTAIMQVNPGEPYVELRNVQGGMPGDGATQIVIYAPDQPGLFATTVAALTRFDLSVVDAIIHTTSDDMCFDVYTVIDQDGNPLERNATVREEIRAQLTSILKGESAPKKRGRKRLSRALRELPWPTEVEVETHGSGDATTITVLASDRPGLLSTLASLLVDLKLQLFSAKITTLGERVEDTFVVVDEHGAAIGPGEPSYTLAQAIRQRLDQAINQH